MDILNDVVPVLAKPPIAVLDDIPNPVIDLLSGNDLAREKFFN
jgi:hypothetical protein